MIGWRLGCHALLLAVLLGCRAPERVASSFELTGSTVRARAETAGASLGDNKDALYLRGLGELDVDGWLFGLQARDYRGDFSAPVGGGDADIEVRDLAPHVGLHFGGPPRGATTQLALRLAGVWQTAHQSQSGGGTIDWNSIGGRVEIEPEFHLIAKRDFGLSFFGRGHFGWLTTDIDALIQGSGGGRALSFTTSGYDWHYELGSRATIGSWFLQASWLKTGVDFERSDVVDGLSAAATSFGFDGFAFGGGVRF